MSSSIPQLTLFPLYPGGPLVRNTGGLSAASSYYTRGTQFTQPYPVNIFTNRNGANDNYRINGTRLSGAQPASVSDSFNTPLAFDARVQGGVKQANVPAVAPSTPNLYKKAVELLSISDLKFSDLMALPSFRIPNIGIGLKVTTDGLGGVDTIELNQSSRGALPRGEAALKASSFPDRTEITTGATFFRSTPTFSTRPPQADNTVAPTQRANPLDAQTAKAIQPFNVNRLDRNANVFRQEQLEQLALRALQDKDFDLDQLDLERLLVASQRENGTAVAGYDSTLNVEQSRQLAANQARFNVNPGDQFRQNIIGLINATRQPNESYAATHMPRMDQAMDGKINVAPWQGASNAGGSRGGYQQGNAFEMGSAVADATSRKGRNSYMPFHMQSDTHSGQSSANANPFSGGGTQSGMNFGSQAQSGQQFRPPRKPIAFIA